MTKRLTRYILATSAVIILNSLVVAFALVASDNTLHAFAVGMKLGFILAAPVALIGALLYAFLNKLAPINLGFAALSGMALSAIASFIFYDLLHIVSPDYAYFLLPSLASGIVSAIVFHYFATPRKRNAVSNDE